VILFHVSYRMKLSVAWWMSVIRPMIIRTRNSGLDGCVCHKWETAPCLEQQNLCNGYASFLFHKATVLYVGDFVQVTCKGLSLKLSVNMFRCDSKDCNCRLFCLL
jgi:hypothetical protein